MAFFNDSFLDDRRTELLNAVKTFQYQINNKSWKTGTVNSKEIDGTDVVVMVDCPSSGSADVITGVRVYDAYGKLAGQQTISLKRTKSYSSGLLRFTFPLVETT